MKKKSLMIKTGVCLLLGLLGTVVFGVIGRRAQPVEKPRVEPSMLVESVVLRNTNCVVMLTGYGTLKSHEYTDIAPEVAGVVDAVHPELEVGGKVCAGDVLFRIDGRGYSIVKQQVRAELMQASNAVIRMKKEGKSIRERLEIEQSCVRLAGREYERYRLLHEEHQVGSASSMENAEQALNQAKTALEQVELEAETYEPKLQECMAVEDAARARLHAAQLDIERCVIRAPYDCRINKCSIEKGQYVDVGQVVLQLADDAVYEVQVPLSGTDAVKWLPRQAGEGHSLYDSVKKIPCRIHWNSDGGVVWTGMLDRVVSYQDGNRMLVVAVQLRADEQTGTPPLDGLFCTVNIPGQKQENVVAVPRYTVSLDGYVCLAVNERLTRRKVHVAHEDDSFCYVDQGLKDGDCLITTKLENPLEGCLLSVK